MYDTLKFIEDNLDDKDRGKFSRMEYDKFYRVVKYMETTNYSQEKLQEGCKDFYNWFNEHDRRRGTNFLETFPELSNFYKTSL
jgi:vacuolar-type H+-ATPase subunit D/Vma8